MTVVPIPTRDGEVLEIEVKDIAGYGRAARPGADALARAAKTFEDALDRVKPIARAIVDTVRSIDVTPEEVEVKFGLKFTAEANVVLSSTAAEANLEFTLKWKISPPASR